MPIYTTRDLIPFVNELESRVNNMVSAVDEWKREKGKILTGLNDINHNKIRSQTALIKSDEALSELGTATFEIVATRGKRLKGLIDSLKNEMYTIAQESGGGGVGFDPRINAEIDNAVASVDAVIEDGLKLDYRLREISERAGLGKEISEKDLIMPYYTMVPFMEVKEYQVASEEGVAFVAGDVTVIDAAGNPVFAANGDMILGTMSDTGAVTLNYAPNKDVKMIYPVKLDFINVPTDFLHLFRETMVQKNSKEMQSVYKFEQTLSELIKDIEAMKGANWTVDFSIMRNHKEIVQESITPKGLQVEVKDGMAHATFSYNDHPFLSHFILEKWDDVQKKWIAYDGTNGVITK